MVHIPYNPDLDKAPHHPWGDVFTVLGASRSFWIGIVLSLLIAGTLGFVVLLII